MLYDLDVPDYQLEPPAEQDEQDNEQELDIYEQLCVPTWGMEESYDR